MPSFFNGPQGASASSVTSPLLTIIIIASIAAILIGYNVWTGSNFFNGPHTSINNLELPNGKINYTGHIQKLQNASGILCLTNQSSSCGTGGGGGSASNVGRGGKGFFSTVVGSTIQLRNLTSTTNLLTISQNVTDVNLSSTFKDLTKTCAGGTAFTAYDNTTGIHTCTAFGSGTITTASNIGKATGSKGTFSSVSGSTIQLRNMSSTRTDLVTINANVTDIIFGSSFKSNTITCTNQFISAFNNATGLYTCTTASFTDTNTAQISNADHANQGLFGTRTNATANTIKSIGAGRGMIDSSNNTHVTITNNMIFLNATSKINSYTVLSTDNLIYVNATATNATITIPSISTMGTGKEITIKKIDYSRNYVKIIPTSATIDYFTNMNLTNPMDSLTLDNNGTTWFTKNKLIFTSTSNILKKSINSWFGGWSNQGTPTTFSLSNNTLYDYPFTLSRATALSKIQFEVSTSGTGAVACRLAIYTDSGQGYPLNKIQGTDVSVLFGNSTGVKTNTFSSNKNLPEGQYHLASQCNSSTNHALQTITLDTISSVTAVTASANATQNISMTVGSGNNNALIVGISLRAAASSNTNVDGITSVKLGSSSFTRAVNVTKFNSTANVSIDSELWYLKNPQTGSVHITITAASTTSQTMVAAAYSLFNVNQTNPLGATASNQTVTRTTSISITPTNPNAWLIKNLYGCTSAGSCSDISLNGNSDTSAWNNPITTNIVGASEYKTNPTISAVNKLKWNEATPTSNRIIIGDVAMEVVPSTYATGSQPTVRAIPSGSLAPLLGMISTMGATNGGTMYQVTTSLGSNMPNLLPDPFPTSATISTTSVPEILVNVVG